VCSSDLERSTLLADGAITVHDLPPEVSKNHAQFSSAESLPVESKLAGHEKALIIQALQECNWNQSQAARQLGVSRDHLRYRIKKYGLKKS